MKTARITFLLPALAACLLPAQNLRAQGSSAPAYYPLNLGVNVGLIGVGADGSLRFGDHFGARGGINYLYYSKTGSIQDSTYDIKLRVMDEPVTLDLYPWADNSFRISLGVAFNQNRVLGSGTGNVTINGNNYPNAMLNLNIQQHAVDPYVSVGGNFFYFDNAHHWSLGGEIGAMYTGTARVGLTSPNVTAADLATEQQKIQNDANKLKFLPVAKIGVNFSF